MRKHILRNSWLLGLYMVLCFIPITTGIAGTIYLAAHGLEGWGWLLFVSLFFTPTFGNKDSDDE